MRKKDLKQEFMPSNKPIPFNDVDHQKVVLTKEQVIARNEATKDYSKDLNKTRAGMGRHQVYLGQKAKNQRAIISRLWGYMKGYRTGFVLVFGSTIITNILAVFLPMLFAIALDDYIFEKDFEGAVYIALIMVGIALLNSLSRFVGRYVMVNISQGTIKKIRKDAFDNLQNLPVKYYDQNQSGDIVSKIANDVDLISQTLAQVVNELISSVIVFIGSFIMMFYMNWVLALVVIAFVPIMIYLTMKIGKITRKGFIAQQKHLGGLNSIIQESVSGVKVIKLYGEERNTISEFGKKNNQYKKASFKANVYAGVIMPVINFLNNFIYLLITVIGGLLYIGGRVAITIGDISAITAYARQFVQPISNMAQLFNQAQQGLAGAERVFNLIDETDEYENDGEITTEDLKGDVEFNNVTFGYFEDKMVLKDINFCADNGKTIAIVGPTGSGKTTIINLLNRFYDLNDGSIKVDGIDITEYKKDNLRKHIGVVLQDTNLFSGTVYENIVYGNHDASEEEVIQAAQLANAHDFIMKLPNGYESEVYEGGQNFSQGERQLISIARTILSNPDILILDEATSNVDTRTEFKIQESMKILMEGRTSFVIAHRLQTIRNAHKILVIKDGELIEQGTHSDLLKEHGFYYDLYTTQFKDLVIE
jgi:ATP-binding cassette subfamily B protein